MHLTRANPVTPARGGLTPPVSSPVVRPLTGRQRLAHLCRLGMEGLVLGMVCLSPWAFGAGEPVFEFLLDAGVALLLGVWALAMLLDGQLTWKRCPVALCLAALFLTAVWQLMPLPRPVLAWLSPATVRLNDQLLPTRPEVLPFGEAHTLPTPPPGSTLSLYPSVTRQEALRLLAVFLLFAAVRNNIASPAALRRLSIAALVNGTLLALFGLVQFFTSPPQTLYWTYPSQGQVFGPFICRNHFPFYVNICLGLGTGLLFASPWDQRPRLSIARGQARPLVPQGEDQPAWHHQLLDLLQEPRTLWVGAGLALMFSGVVLCLSRGGLLALGGGFLVCLLIQGARSARFSRLAGVLITVGVGLGLLTWFGFGYVEARLATVWKGKALQEARLPLWSRCLPLAQDFPLWGTGPGTFPYVEPLHRGTALGPEVIVDHAHNEYLEALVEGGVLRLALSLLAVALVFRLGWRAVRRHEGGRSAGLALGALFGLTTVVIHNIGDFGLHLPAIVVLVAVVGAQLSALGAPSREEGSYSFRLFGLAPLLGAVTLVALGVILVGEGWRADQVQRYRLAAYRLNDQPAPDRAARQVALLEAAARLAPGFARLQLELGQAYFTLYDHQLDQWERQDRLGDVAQAVLTTAPTPFGALATVPTWLTDATARRGLHRPEEAEAARAHLAPALRHMVQARDLCPLLAPAQVRIAGARDRLAQADPAVAYLDRAKRLAGNDPELWYLSGVQNLLDGRPEQAWPNWRRSLELTDDYMPRILATATRTLDTAALLERVLPERPDVVIAAAMQLHPGPEGAERRRPFLERALVLLDRQPGVPSAEDWHTKALLHRALKQAPAAVAALQMALRQDPQQVGWRYELAGLLRQEGSWKEARQELQAVLGQQPTNAEARRLLDEVERCIAEKL